MAQAINIAGGWITAGTRPQPGRGLERGVMRERCDHDQRDENHGAVDGQRVDAILGPDSGEQAALQSANQGSHPVVSNQSNCPE